MQSRGGWGEEHAPRWSCLRLTSRDEDLGSGDEVVVVFSPTVCSVVVLRLVGGPAGVCGDARLVGVGRVVVRWWVVLVLVSRREGGWWWWEVVESVSVGWQSACGLWEETGGGWQRRGRETGQRARQEQASQQAQAKQSGVPRRKAASEQSRSRGEGIKARQAKRPPTTVRNVNADGEIEGLCVRGSVPDDLPFAE